MPVATESIIAPGKPGSKSPLKKSTVLWGVGIVLLLAGMIYYLPRALKKAPDSVPDIEQPADTKPAQQPRSISDEFKAPRLPKPTEPVLPVTDSANTGTPVVGPMPAPLPSSGVGPLAKADPTGRKSRQSTPEDAAIERDADARSSRLMVNDDGGKVRDEDTKTAFKSGEAPQVGQDLSHINGASSDIEERQVRNDRMLDRLASAQQGRSASSAQDRDRAWLKEFAGLKASKSIQPSRPSGKYMLMQGKVIPAVLGKELNSDLPGDITAYTTVDIYDSITGRNLLVPKGSTLVGEYSNNVRSGQSRLMFAFSRIVLPNGMSFDLPGNKGQDQQGASGVEGDVNHHVLSRFGNALLVAVLANAVERKVTNVTQGAGSTGGANSAAGQVLVDIARADLGKSIDIPPTITIPQGARINVQVAADMEFPQPYAGK